MTKKYLDVYDYWVSSTKDDTKTQDELLSIKNDKNEMEERFYKALEFGTGGLRGILGSGINRMNIYTVRQAAQGIADYIKTQGEVACARGVVISYDCRHQSREFADASARVLAANGIKAFIFDKLNPTPILSFAVRHLKAFAGIMITASHNPPKYNGFKVYGEDGAQLNMSASDEVIKIILTLDIFKDVHFLSPEQAKNSELICEIGASVVDAFIEEALSLQLASDVDKKNLKIVFTPFHGTGLAPVCEILRRTGYENVFVVEEQALIDPDFSTVKSPNPEEREGFNMAVALAKDICADLIIGTDPDADRIGVLARDSGGEYKAFTGNQTGVLLTDYILEKRLSKGLAGADDYIVSTIVTTDLVSKIAAHYGVSLYKVYTGFKFIAELIKNKEEDKSGNYVFGFEESYGYLPGTYARDKDAVTTALLICEMAAICKSEGKGLIDALTDIYKKFGFYTEKTTSIYMEGISGMEDMKKLMNFARENPMRKFGDMEVLAFNDYSKSIRHDFITGQDTNIDMETADVLLFELAGGGFFAMRPSGTEPKIKLYYSVVTDSQEEGERQIKYIENQVRQILGVK